MSFENLGFGFVPLMASYDRLEIMQLLVNKGANVNLQSNMRLASNYQETDDKSEETSEFISETTSLLIAVKFGDGDSAILLLRNGALPNIKNTYGDSPLSIAVQLGRLEIVRELLKFGADPNIKNRDGKPLTKIAKENKEKEIVLLLEKALNNK